MAFVLRLGKPLAMLVACVTCMICTGTLGGYINDIYVKKTGENDKTKAEKGSAIAFSIVMCIALMVYFVLGLFI
jgi:hypothetical protein